MQSRDCFQAGSKMEKDTQASTKTQRLQKHACLTIQSVM